ncbi:MAG: hypothetical protein ABSD62_01830 [Candidatus Limnocylindrales bacterium]
MVFFRASQLIDLWLAAAKGVRWAWRTLPGDLLGFMVMRCSGVSRPNRMSEAGDVTALVVEDPRVGRYLDTGFMPIHAQTVGRYVFCRGPMDERVLAHECEHIRQWRRFGPLYLPLYFGLSLVGVLRGRRPYFDNRFEVAARRRAELDT